MAKAVKTALRTTVNQFYSNQVETEQIEWAAKELGIPRATFNRMAALKFAKEVLDK